MAGGKRENAGRKAIPEKEKRKGTTIYLREEEYNMINEMMVGNSFSQKCLSMIELGIEKYKENFNNKIRFIDLFAGMGGIRIGFERALNTLGIETECVFSSEIKKHAIVAYSNYFNDKEVNGDITKVRTSDIPQFDILLAGFPCQPFSSAGNRLGFKDTRGTLFFEIERILLDKQPYAFILENVEGLINHDKGNTFNVILERLNELGYKVNAKMLDSKFFGLAQSRKRVYIVGTKTDYIDLDNFKEITKKFKEIQEKVEGIKTTKFTQKLLEHFKPNELYGKSIKDKRGGEYNIHSWDIGIKGIITKEQKELLELLLKERRKKKWAEEIGIKWMDGMPLTLEQIRTFYNKDNLKDMLDDLVNKKYISLEYPKNIVNGKREYDTSKQKGYNIVTGKLSFEFSKILDPNDIAPTLVATDVSKLGVIDGDKIRKLTLREGQRLFGFPEDYDLEIIKYSEGLDLLGNTVCIPVIEEISKRLGKIILEKREYDKLRIK